LGGEKRHPSYGNAGVRPFLFGPADLASCSVHPNLESKPERGEANDGGAMIVPLFRAFLKPKMAEAAKKHADQGGATPPGVGGHRGLLTSTLLILSQAHQRK
jgi:hypothetical protein